MYEKQLDLYLTHYQPQLKEELLRMGTLQEHLAEQNAAMLRTRQQILAELTEQYPQLSQLQRELEADQMVRELYLTIR